MLKQALFSLLLTCLSVPTAEVTTNIACQMSAKCIPILNTLLYSKAEFSENLCAKKDSFVCMT